MEIREMRISDYDAVAALWHTISGFAIRSLDDCRVRQAIVDDRILIGITGLDCTRQTGQ